MTAAVAACKCDLKLYNICYILLTWLFGEEEADNN